MTRTEKKHTKIHKIAVLGHYPKPGPLFISSNERSKSDAQSINLFNVHPHRLHPSRFITKTASLSNWPLILGHLGPSICGKGNAESKKKKKEGRLDHEVLCRRHSSFNQRQLWRDKAKTGCCAGASLTGYTNHSLVPSGVLLPIQRVQATCLTCSGRAWH